MPNTDGAICQLSAISRSANSNHYYFYEKVLILEHEPKGILVEHRALGSENSSLQKKILLIKGGT